MMTTSTSHGRLFRALVAVSTHTARSYRSVWGPAPRRTQRTAEEIALHG
jgi:hypothetical protein